jgi:hypothetical protein
LKCVTGLIGLPLFFAFRNLVYKAVDFPGG